MKIFLAKNRCFFNTIIIKTVMLLLVLISNPTRAEQITVGSGSGIVWEGMPFSGSISGARKHSGLDDVSFVSIGTVSEPICTFAGQPQKQINGIDGLELASGLLLVPRIKIDGSFIRHNGEKAIFKGAIGVENNLLMDNGTNMKKQNTSSPWCFSPEGTFTSTIDNYFSESATRTINYSGTWVIIADGTQQEMDNIIIPSFYIGSYTGAGNKGNIKAQILPTSLTLRVSTSS